MIAVPTWSSSNPWIWTIPLSGVPATLSGPIVHAIHGRWVPAIASFFGWASVVATGWLTGGLLQMGDGQWRRSRDRRLVLNVQLLTAPR